MLNIRNIDIYRLGKCTHDPQCNKHNTAITRRSDSKANQGFVFKTHWDTSPFRQDIILFQHRVTLERLTNVPFLEETSGTAPPEDAPVTKLHWSGVGGEVRLGCNFHY